MGLFSSKKVTTVGTSVVRLIQDKNVPDSIINGMVKSKQANDDQLIEYVFDEMSGSIAYKADRMYQYGKRSYTHGLPTAALVSAIQGRDQVIQTIESQVGGAIAVEYFHFGTLNGMHKAWETLTNQHGYDEDTNEVTTLSLSKGFKVYLKNMFLVVTEATIEEQSNGSLVQWGRAPNSGYTQDSPIQLPLSLKKLVFPDTFRVDSNAPNDYVRVDVTWIALDKSIKTETFNIQLGAPTEGDYYQVKYTINGLTKYWTYLAGYGTHPIIDAASVSSNPLGSYFPFGYFRYEGKSASDSIGSNSYVTSKKLLKYLNIDYADMIKSIHENPDINSVEQAMLVIAVPADTKNEVEQRYLFDYFKEMHALVSQENSSKVNDIDTVNLAITSKNETNNSRSIIIQDKRFKTTLGFSNIVKRNVTGSIGVVGKVSGELVKNTSSITGFSTQGYAVPWVTDTNYFVYRKQITETMYEELYVMGLKMTYHIYGEYSFIGDDSNTALLVPVDRHVSKTYSAMDKEELYSRALHLVFNSRTVTTVKWYQQAWFKSLLVVVMVIITIYTLGKTIKALLAAIAAATVTITGVLYMVMIEILKYIAIQVGLKLFVKAVGTKLAFIVAIVAAVIGGYNAIQAGSIAGAPWASELLALSSNLSNSVNKQLANDMQGLKREADAFKKEMDSKTELLTKAESLLDNKHIMTPLVIWGETPNEYFNRTIHSGNIGIVGIEAISSYVDVSLALPKLSTTLGEIENVI